MIKKQIRQGLDIWIRQASHAGVREIHQFARGRERDYDAVKAALETPHSNGMVEGQINRLKMIKCQMYGRAGLTLLRIRVLYGGANRSAYITQSVEQPN